MCAFLLALFPRKLPPFLLLIFLGTFGLVKKKSKKILYRPSISFFFIFPFPFLLYSTIFLPSLLYWH